MSEDILKTLTSKMQKSLESLIREFKTLRAGRATPSLLDKVTMDYYGTSTPLNQLANISAPEPRLLVVQPWDKGIIAEVEKALLRSDLGLTPNNDGTVIRLPIPELTRERRQELVKVIKRKAEESRVIIRNFRREGNDIFKEMGKNKEISEDEVRHSQNEVQKITDKYIKEIDSVLQDKEKEVLKT